MYVTVKNGIGYICKMTTGPLWTFLSKLQTVVCTRMSVLRRKQLLGGCVALFIMFFVIQMYDHTGFHVDSGDFVPLQSDKLFLQEVVDNGARDKLARTLDLVPNGCKLVDFNHKDTTQFDLRIIIVTYNRPKSLIRLVKSLNRAHYGSDRVKLEIFIDRSKSQLVHQETLQLLRNVTFEKGLCNVIVHPYHVGIRGQWLATWTPQPDSTEIAVILEDDLTVSPYYYSFLKLAHQKYGHRQDIYGFTLQGKTVKHSDGLCCVKVPKEHPVYLYPTLGTSGFSPRREHWIKFHEYLKYVLIGEIPVPLIENHIAKKWYVELSKIGKGDSMWEMEYLSYTHKQNQFTLYPNFINNQGFTFNWYEDGLHSTGVEIDTRDERKNLVYSWNMTQDSLPDYPIRVNNNGDLINTQQTKK